MSENQNSILMDVREACDVVRDNPDFDDKLIPLINSQLMIAHQFGVGYNGFNVSGTSESWTDLLGEGTLKLAAMKTWLGYSVKLLFDPPDNGTVSKSLQDQVDKMAWYLCSKSKLEKHIQKYVPEYADEYEDL